MPSKSEFTQMLRALQAIYSAEGRPGGDEAAAALGDVLNAPFDLPPAHTLEIVASAIDTMGSTEDANAGAVLSALHLFDWHHSGLEDGRIRPEFALSMATTELIGPTGMIYHPTVRVGLFLQSANLDYVTRTHPAEETFFMLGGSGLWTCNGSSPEVRTVGDYIFHPSDVPHASITKETALIATWRWTGDIAYEGYCLTG